MSEEIWKDIPGYEGAYSASNLGRIRSNYRERLASRGIGISSTPTKILKSCDNGRGYKSVMIRLGNKSVRKYVHRIVAETFLGFRLPPLEVNHMDGNKSNNCLANLEWVTRKENIHHAIRLGLKPKQINRNLGGYNPRSKKLVNLETGIIYDCTREAAEAHCINPYTLRYRVQNNIGFMYL